MNNLIKTGKKLNIAIICDPISDNKAGVIVSTVRFSESLRSRGHNVIFIASKLPKGPSFDYFDGFKVYRFFSILVPKSEGQWRLGFPTFSDLKNIFINEKIDVVHIILPTPASAISARVANSLGIGMVAHSHSQPENIFLHLRNFLRWNFLNIAYNRYISWIYKKAGVVIYPSEFARKHLEKLNKNIRGVVISNGVNMDVFKKTDPKAFIKKFQISRETVNVLFVGRLHPEKSVDTLIKSMSHLIRKKIKVHLYIVGGGHLENKLKKLTNRLKLDQHISFLGKISDEDLILAYNACDVFVLPSLAELEGMVVLEAMACGMPIIIANAEQSASVYFVSDNGFLFEPRNVRDLAKKIEILATDKKVREDMGKASLEKSRQYDMNQSVSKLEEVYYSVLSNKS
jgi:glycosyltransferase involved in cell wall biosynthesis